MSNSKNKIRLLGPPCSHGTAVVAKQGDDGSVQLGDIRPCKEGMPVPPDTSLVKLEKTDDPAVFTYTTLYEARKGPAKVASPAFRQGWDNVFGDHKPSTDKKELN